MTEVTDRAERDVQRTLEEGDRGSDSPEKPVEVQTRHRGGFFCHNRIFGPVTNDYGDLALLACSLVTGMVDAASFANWSVFCGMQTGMYEFIFSCSMRRSGGVGMIAQEVEGCGLCL